jgi:hypothetical protein
MRWHHSFAVPSLCLMLSGCLTNTPDPTLGGVYACVEDTDCPESLSCLQQVCESIELPRLQILNPEDTETYPFGSEHNDILSVSGTNLTLRPRAASSEAVPGEGHLVVFVDEVEVAVIDSGDISAGVQVAITIPDMPGAHRVRVQARLNDGTDYDNADASARNLVWVDDGREHVALRKPWPGEVFGLESGLIDAEVATLGGIAIGSPNTGNEHVHVYYDAVFPACLTDPACDAGYNGVVPSNDDSFGPVLLPASAAGMVTLTAVVAEADHTTYVDEMGDRVFSQIQILRSDNQ